MRLGLFGGSFDPIHLGHVEPVLEAQRRLGLDRVLFLPTAAPPHKPEQRFAPALARFAMAELALLDHPRTLVSAHELTLGRPAYTVETLESFRAEEPGSELFLIVGADSFFDLPNWRRWSEIPDLARLVVLARPGFALDGGACALAPRLRTAVDAGEVHFVENPPLAASSREIRRLLAAGEEIPEGWMEPRVVRYLAKYSLYR